MRNSAFRIFAFIAVFSTAAQAETAAISFTSSVEFETGDTWTLKNRRYRLYGVQSCLRGTEFVSAEGQRSDCGLHSIAPLLAMFSTNTVACQPVGQAKDMAIFVVCAAQIENVNIDVGTALIATGNAFAAVYPDGNPVNTDYLVAEITAKSKGDGLWSGQFTHPIDLLLKRR